MNTNYDIDEVIKYFYEISKIPRRSGKEEKIANYIEDFAKKRNLKYIRDFYNNIIIIKDANKWNKSDESIILQCHLDMVCEKTENSNHDFDKDGLDLYIEDDFIKAKETTLGADNGIGVAIILAILNSNDINHPRLEVIFTVQEETTMDGAKQIDLSMLKGNKMICLDNMNEEELWIGCAGAKIFEYNIPKNIKKISQDYILIKIELNGFVGGHSGKDIDKQRGNPIKEMGNLLVYLYNKYGILIKNIFGGNKVNVIPRECYSEIYIKYDDINQINQDILKFNKKLKKQYNNSDIFVSLTKITDISKNSLDLHTSKNIINIINKIPNGVYHSDKYNNPLVSLNIGEIKIDNTISKICFSIRSNREKKEIQLINELQNIKTNYDINENISELTGYEHKEWSSFIDKCKKIYIQYFNRKPKVVDMHICLEAGFLANKISNLDFIAIAPNIYDAHSPKERCSLSSLKKVYNYIILILENI